MIVINEITETGTGKQHSTSITIINFNFVTEHDDLVQALFEVLNPEQNSNFVDRFIGVPVDLSKVLFIITTIHEADLTQPFWKGRMGPLKNKVRIVEFLGYATEEKIKIVKEYIIPKWQRKLWVE